MVTADDVRDYINDRGSIRDADINRALSVGAALVDAQIGNAVDIPDAVTDLCYLIAASEILARKDAPMGISQYATPDGAPVRVNKDPLTSVYPLLAPYLGWGIA